MSAGVCWCHKFAVLLLLPRRQGLLAESRLQEALELSRLFWPCALAVATRLAAALCSLVLRALEEESPGRPRPPALPHRAPLCSLPEGPRLLRRPVLSLRRR